MFGKNIIMKAERGDGSLLSVNSIFYTIQGEGPNAGQTAVFIRLAGCNLRCHFCDTDFDTFQVQMHVDDIVGLVREVMQPHCRLAVITGGEPLRQPIGLLVRRLRAELGMRTQVETAGTLWPEGLDPGEGIEIVCSPKTGSVHPVVEEYCTDWKYIFKEGEQSLEDGLPAMSTQIAGNPAKIYRPKRGIIWVQAMEEYYPDGTPNRERTQKNLEGAAAAAMRFGYRLTVQMHKLANLE